MICVFSPGNQCPLFFESHVSGICLKTPALSGPTTACRVREVLIYFLGDLPLCLKCLRLVEARRLDGIIVHESEDPITDLELSPSLSRDACLSLSFIFSSTLLVIHSKERRPLMLFPHAKSDRFRSSGSVFMSHLPSVDVVLIFALANSRRPPMKRCQPAVQKHALLPCRTN